MISFERLKEILERFSKVKIAVVGDMMLDEYLIGKVSRISPEAPVPVVNIEQERFVLGGASNVANNLKSLSAQVSVYGVVGKDSNGEKFVKELESKNIDPSGIVIDETRPTIIKSRVLSQGQQLLRLDWEKDTDITENIQKKIIENVEKNIEKTDALLLSDYNKGVLTEFVSQSIIKIAKKYNREVVVDPKPNNFKNYKGATSMTPNRKEILDYFGMKKFQNEEEIAQKMSDWSSDVCSSDLQGGYPQQAPYPPQYQTPYQQAPTAPRNSANPVLLTLVVVLAVVLLACVSYVLHVTGVINIPFLGSNTSNSASENQNRVVPDNQGRSAAPAKVNRPTSPALPAGAVPANASAWSNAPGGKFENAYVGSSVTSSEFASEVQKSFFSQYQLTKSTTQTLYVVSPVTGQLYEMNCSDNSQYVTCTGGINAVVYIT